MVSSRDQMLNASRALFADRGFYGVSLAQIAAELDVTKQALLHHFSTKEKLYGEVLRQVSDDLAALRHELAKDYADPAEQLKAFLMAMAAGDAETLERTALLMRELLDNKRRADTAGTWYLGPFLDGLIDLVLELPAWADASPMEALALIYQLLGALTYYRVSGPTLTGIFGQHDAAALEHHFLAQLSILIEAGLAAGPPR